MEMTSLLRVGAAVSVACSACGEGSKPVALSELDSHIADRHVTRLEWGCGECSESSASFDVVAAHALLAGHDLASIRRDEDAWQAAFLQTLADIQASVDRPKLLTAVRDALKSPNGESCRVVSRVDERMTDKTRSEWSFATSEMEVSGDEPTDAPTLERAESVQEEEEEEEKQVKTARRAQSQSSRPIWMTSRGSTEIIADKDFLTCTICKVYGGLLVDRVQSAR